MAENQRIRRYLACGWSNRALLKMLRILILIFCLAQVAFAHPICVDSTAPFKRRGHFSKCRQYNRKPVCISPGQEKTLVRLPKFENPRAVPTRCKAQLLQISCAIADAWSGHLFRAEGPGDYLAAPMLCQQYCKALYHKCSSVPMSQSPFVLNSTTHVTMASLFPTVDEFCTTFASDDYCYKGVPFKIPPPQPYRADLSICTERVLKGNDPYVNMQPVPGYANLMMMGDLSGIVKIFSVNNNETGEAFTLASTLINLRSKIAYSGEQGLLGVAMHKDFASNGRFFVSFTCGDSANIDCDDGDSVVDEYRVVTLTSNPASLVADVTTRRRIFKTPQPFENHNGGLIIFSPDPEDPHLYMMLGDGGSANDPNNNAQPLNKVLGKILRIDVDSTFDAKGLGVAPSDNPFVGVPGANPLIWANGMRNPWRCSFDRSTYLFYCGDVGQNTVEEIDIITKGANYGWSRFEGTLTFNTNHALQGSQTVTMPILTYTHADMHSGGYASVTGGYVMRSDRDPRINGKYIFSDLSGPIFLANENPPGSQQWSKSRIGMECADSSPLACVGQSSIVSYGEMLSGDILIADFDGNVFRIVEPQKCGFST